MYLLLLDSFFFNDPATTESYTYSHTLSLNDALPIGNRMLQIMAADHARAADRSLRSASDYAETQRKNVANRETDRRPTFQGQRTEEHTSELQSLMRNSYAVLCLTTQIVTI